MVIGKTLIDPKTPRAIGKTHIDLKTKMVIGKTRTDLTRGMVKGRMTELQTTRAVAIGKTRTCKQHKSAVRTHQTLKTSTRLTQVVLRPITGRFDTIRPRLLNTTRTAPILTQKWDSSTVMMTTTLTTSADLQMASILCREA